MLYPTHKRYGQAYAFLGIPVMILLGYFPKLDLSLGLGVAVGDAIVVFLYMFVAYKGSLFGAEFPDIDSPGSIPARKHYFLSKLFRFFKVKHRGKFSHDFASLGILFGGIYLFVDMGLGELANMFLVDGVGNSELTPLVALLSEEGLVLNLIKTYILFTLIGAYSHLIADATTKQGVWLFWTLKIKFIPERLIKMQIFGYQPFKYSFRTGSGWEDFNRYVMTVVLALGIVATLLVVVVY